MKKLGKRLSPSKNTITAYGCGALCIAHCLCTGTGSKSDFNVTDSNRRQLDPLVSGR